MKIREKGIQIGNLDVGEKNCITDVQGVKVGHITLEYRCSNSTDVICTGVTAILPHSGNLFREKVVAASYVLNGFGKTAGLVQVDELGQIESPIMLTNTFGIPAVTQGTLQFMLQENPEIGYSTGTINIVVGECNDSYLNSIRSFPVKPEHAIEAIRLATTEVATEGAVGAGKGMVCFGFKGGIGCSSRIITDKECELSYTVGCLVLSNFGKRESFLYNKYLKTSTNTYVNKQSDGSIIIVLATDAPLNSRQLRRVAKRCGIGLGRTGSHFSHGSGDIVIAFSTATKVQHFVQTPIETIAQLRDDHPIMNRLFEGAADATEEAIINSLSQGTTTYGRDGRVVYACPFE